ncbi:hypothetical protein S83_050431, partial [Arachis hypogaea]
VAAPDHSQETRSHLGCCCEASFSVDAENPPLMQKIQNRYIVARILIALHQK